MSKIQRPLVTKTTKVTVQTETLMIFRHAKATRGWCPDCRAEVNAVSLDDNAFADPVTRDLIREWLATSKVHVLHPANGPAQICLTSLLACFASTEAQRASFDIKKQLEEIRRKQ